MWRLVLNRIATLDELNRGWTLAEIYKANALLDMQADTKAQAADDAERRRGK